MPDAETDGGSPTRKAARRFLLIFGGLVASITLVVATINLYAFSYMLRDENQAIVQLLSGWGRMYKPILHDQIEPDVVVFGASWARDAFDPITSSRLIGMKLFNHGVSGGTVYETRRFVESALTNPNLKAAIINLDTIYRDADQLTKYGFDERILNVRRNGKPNRWAWLRRAYSLGLTGWAIATNLELIAAVHARDAGAAPADYLPAYQQADIAEKGEALDVARRRIFPPPGSKPLPNLSRSLTPFQREALNELDSTIDSLCERGVDVHAYFTPRHAVEKHCDENAEIELETLEFLRRKQAMCPAQIHYYDFAYPNPVTLEGVQSPVTSSKYYRPDGHPRPTVGLLMLARMFGVDFPPGTAPEVKADFGADLLADPDPEGWLLDHYARCRGDWR